MNTVNKSLYANIITVLLLLLIFGVALYLRAVLPYHDVFVDKWMKLTGNDAFVYMRFVDNFTFNFPNLSSYDPYLRFPEGLTSGSPNLFVIILGTIVRIFSFGQFNQATVDIIGIYFPAVSGALAIIPAFFIGKVIFNRWAGIITAGLMATLPGELLGRTVLGYTDRDSLAILFNGIIILLIIMAIKTSANRAITPPYLKQLTWKIIFKPVIYSFSAGLLLGIYLCYWVGGFTLVMALLAFNVIQLIYNHFTGQSAFYLVSVNSIITIISLILFSSYSQSPAYLLLLLSTLLLPVLLFFISNLMNKFSLKPLYFPVAITAIVLIAILAFYFISPSLFQYFIDLIIHYLPFSSTESTVMESQSILFPGGQFSLLIIWGNFTTCIVLALIALGILCYLQVKQKNEVNLLFITWCLIMLILTLLTRRIAVLFSLNVALLSAYLLWLILSRAGFKEPVVQQVISNQPVTQIRKGKKAKQKISKKHFEQSSGKYTWKALAVIFVLVVGFLPNTLSALETSSHAPFAPDNGWYEALDWLKNNSPEPFNDPQTYYKYYKTPFKYPDTAYGVISWWDYGYWIIRNAHRLPVCDPGGGDRINTARFLTAQNQPSANKIIDELKSKYVIIDLETTLGKFYAIAIHSGKRAEDFFDVYYQQTGKNLVPLMVYYPEYYLAEAVRLYNFDGKEVIPPTVNVISYIEKKNNQNELYREIINIKPFNSYKDAETYIKNQKTGNHRIAGIDPFISPVPLEAATNYKLVYKSNSSVNLTGSNKVSVVKIFEYQP